MLSSTRKKTHAAKTICWHIRTSREAHKKLSQAAGFMGLNPNARARVIELLSDAVVEFSRHYRPARNRGPRVGRPKFPVLTIDSVMSIRSSSDKIMAIAAEHGISEAMVCAVRSRTCYAWVD